jgi:methyltransferase (TIGR00027 family)
MIRRRLILPSVLAWALVATVGNFTPVSAQGSAQDATASATPTRTGSTRMDEGHPSVTAQSTAQLRAAHQILDTPRILDDPLALRIIGAQAEAALRANPQREQRMTTLRAFVALRSRYAEDELARAVKRGVRQYVILGAGLDTFAYRNPYPGSGLRVFEVDHPATQSWKRARLRESGIDVPASLTFAPVDFEKETLADGLRRAGFKADEPAFFSLLGVVVYLTKDAVLETLKFVASMPAGSEIVFDYALPSSALSERERATREAMARRVAALGEPWITYFDPPDLQREVRHLGFKLVEDLGPREANDRYFKDRQDGLRLGGVAHLLKAGR